MSAILCAKPLSLLLVAAATAASALSVSVSAQPPRARTAHAVSPSASALARAFEAAWSRRPESHSLDARRAAAAARQQAARGWTPAPPAFEAFTRTDRASSNDGLRENEAGLAVPLWLPGERASADALARAQASALESGASAARLRLAGELRDAWWAWQGARIDLDVATGQRDSAQQLAGDVARRVQAGELAPADQLQAEGAVATADAMRAQAQVEVSTASARLRTLTGIDPTDTEAAGRAIETVSEPEPGSDSDAFAAVTSQPLQADTSHPPELVQIDDRQLGSGYPPDGHAVLKELQDRADVSRRAAELARRQRRPNPELTVGLTREREAFGESWGRSVLVGVRIPFGGGARHRARMAQGHAEALEAQALLEYERERLISERDASQARVAANRDRLAAAESRARLARQTREFFVKSFRLGETDLPMRLRVEAEAIEASRQAARARVDLAAAISAWRQALGLLPH